MTKSLQGWVVCVFMLFTFSMSAQDIHFSQFYHSPINQNPALIGVFSGDQRFIGNYRSQWNQVPVGYVTASGAYDQRVDIKKLENSLVSIGGIINYDKSGDSDLKLVNVGLGGSVTHQMAENHFLSVGLLASVSQRSFSYDKLNFNAQFGGEIFNPALPTGEEGFNKLSSKLFVDASIGANWHYQVPTKRRKLDFGASILHLNQPKVNFYENEDIRLFARWNGFFDFSTMVSQKVDFLIRGSAQFQNKYRENLVGIAARYYLNQSQYNELGLQLGVAMRFQGNSDAIAPGFEVHYQNWMIGFTYDINISEFNVATSGRGGPELAVIHKIYKIKDLREVKNCPIY